MTDSVLIRQLAGVVSNGTPLVLAAVGETLTERSGVINLSLDGSLLISALAGFVVALAVQNTLVATVQDSNTVTVLATLAGILAAMVVGMIVALIVAASSIELKQSQVAVGFVLTLLCRDLAIFLGAPYRNSTGLPVLFMPIPVLSDIPVIGPILFQHDLFTYLSFIAVIGAWFWIFRTKPGLALRSAGERPETAFARGSNVNRLRYVYTAVGGALVGLGGAAFTLSLNSTWAESSIGGNGWIALAIVIFGGWHPVRVAFGVYLVTGLRALVTGLQSVVGPEVIQLLNATPWILMLVTLLVVSSPERLLKVLPRRFHPAIRALLRARPPTALGTNFDVGS